MKNIHKIKDNIYITSSNEDINENDYIITKDGRLVQVSYLLSDEVAKGFKVILTTDDLLIKDGVQAIDNEFLQWFANNPSCEWVEVAKFHGVNTSIAEISSISGNDDYNWKGQSDLRDYKIIIPKEEHEQETLGEAAREYYRRGQLGLEKAADTEYAFIKGAKWQAERMYSKEEVLEHLNHLVMMPSSKLDSYTDDDEMITMKWFEKFKKK